MFQPLGSLRFRLESGLRPRFCDRGPKERFGSYNAAASEYTEKTGKEEDAEASGREVTGTTASPLPPPAQALFSGEWCSFIRRSRRRRWSFFSVCGPREPSTPAKRSLEST